MKQITIVSKAEAARIEAEMGAKVRRSKYCNGKYESRPEVPYVGRQVEAFDDVVAIYPAHQRDRYGAYVRLLCLLEVN